MSAIEEALRDFERLAAETPPSSANGNGHHKQPEGEPASESSRTWQAHFRPVDEILADEGEAIDWLVDGIVPRGWAGGLMGDTKVGKTLWTFGLAHAVATGGQFLGKPARQGKVLLALADDPPALSRKRLQALAGCPNVYASLNRWTLEVAAALAVAVKETKPALVVIDTLVKTVSSTKGDENDSSTMDRILEAFVSWTTNEETTVLVIHHLNKGGSVRGSTAIEGALPFVLRLNLVGANGEKLSDEDDADDSRERLVKLTTDWKLEPVEPILMRYKDGVWQRRGTIAEVRAENLVERILTELGHVAGQTADELAKKVRTRAATVREALQQLKGEGRVRCETMPCEGKGRPKECWSATSIFRPTIGDTDGTENTPTAQGTSINDGHIFRPDTQTLYGTENQTADASADCEVF